MAKLEENWSTEQRDVFTRRPEVTADSGPILVEMDLRRGRVKGILLESYIGSFDHSRIARFYPP